ncbi:hypothetical protein LOAG_15470 [Loa loa]|uniref:Uncharacterized protein n=1 Tax=Loa loa TaxID=7209 RepID=A0A1S0TFS3_LOALO|nr:hypothetical protein LOAG_15470 [Loa loa]EFO13059.1 hypothetical protein LOAG_15470 [Loa loa]
MYVWLQGCYIDDDDDDDDDGDDDDDDDATYNCMNAYYCKDNIDNKMIRLIVNMILIMIMIVHNDIKNGNDFAYSYNNDNSSNDNCIYSCNDDNDGIDNDDDLIVMIMVIHDNAHDCKNGINNGNNFAYDCNDDKR